MFWDFEQKANFVNISECFVFTMDDGAEPPATEAAKQPQVFQQGVVFSAAFLVVLFFDNKIFIMFQVFLIIMNAKEKPDLVSSLLIH